MLLWILCGILLCLIIILTIKIYLLKKSINEICLEFREHLSSDTNTLISVSSRDKHIRKLANQINIQLRKLRLLQKEYFNGNMELKDAVTNISHDLRTPLTAISGYLDLLAREENAKDFSRYISIINNRCKLLKQLTEELFLYSVTLTKEHSFKTEAVHINRLLEESIASFYTDFMEQHIVPTIQITQQKIIWMADRSALSRVFSNILHNAVKYSAGDLDICLTDSGTVTFANTAYGLNETEVGKLFDRFYTIEDARISTGLGLSIAKTLISQMEGSILAEYKENRLSISVWINSIREK